ncbi:unnamed protein product [Discosporangium mesarthrocarpum]
MSAAVMTQLDIANAVSQRGGQVPHSSKTCALDAVLSIVAYLQACPDLGMTYGGMQECVMSAFADASYAGVIDNRRPDTGGAAMFCGAAVSWMSEMQNVIALSSTESEYIALSSAAQEVMFLRNVLEFMQPSLPRVCIKMLRIMTVLQSWLRTQQVLVVERTLM